MQFQLLLPSRVLFESGKRSELGREAGRLGTAALVICGSRTLRDSQLWAEMLAGLGDHDVSVVDEILCLREPTVDDVDAAAAQLKTLDRSIDVVIGIGGGAAIDLAKAIAAMATNCGRSVRSYLEGVGDGSELKVAPLPVLAVPTTAGTGSEATKNAVISVDDPQCKKSLRSEKLLPATVLIDPELTLSNSPTVTACSGMDAITQLIESYTSRRANSLTQAVCLEGLRSAFPNLSRAVNDPSDLHAREAMSYGAFLSGVALANSGLGMAHGVAAALGSICEVPHGLACAVMLPIALEVNQQSAAAQQAELGRICAGQANLSYDEAIAASIEKVRELADSIGIPKRLRDLNVDKTQLDEIVTGSRGNSMSGNPTELSDAELKAILEANW